MAPTRKAAAINLSEAGTDEGSIAFQIWESGVLLQRSANAPDSPITLMEPGYRDTNFGGQRWRTLARPSGNAERWILVAERADIRFRLAEDVILEAVMPIIFGSTLLLIPTMIGSAVPGLGWLSDTFGSQRGFWYVTTFTLLIFFFSFFWTSMMFQPTEIANNLREGGSFVPGIRPGKPTADYLDRLMTRITMAGALFLTCIAVLPILLNAKFGIPYLVAQFFGGTSMLIMVGVMLDTMRQIETHLIQRHYDGFLRKGRIRGKRDARLSARTATLTSGGNGMLYIYLLIAILVIAGMSYYIYSL